MKNKWATLVGLAFGLAQAVEGEMPAGSGKDKLAAVVGIGQVAFQQEETLRASWGQPDQFAAALTNAVGVAVGVLNAVGVFKKRG